MGLVLVQGKQLAVCSWLAWECGSCTAERRGEKANLGAFQIVEHHRQALGISVLVPACSAPTDTEHTMDLGTPLKTVHI